MSRKLFNFLCDTAATVCAAIVATAFITFSAALVSYVTSQAITESELKFDLDKTSVVDATFACVLMYLLFCLYVSKTLAELFQFVGVATLVVLKLMVVTSNVGVMAMVSGSGVLKSEFLHVCIASAALTVVVLVAMLVYVAVDFCYICWREYKDPDECAKSKAVPEPEGAALLEGKV